MIAGEIRDRVRVRAEFRCEYCLLSEHHSPLTHHIEHIQARQHGGLNDLANLALACQRCNLQKGPNLSAIDPHTSEIVLLFHPRKMQWLENFRTHGPRIDGITPIGRATVHLLGMNDQRRLELRTELAARSLFP